MKKRWSFLEVATGLILLGALALVLSVSFQAVSRNGVNGAAVASPTQCAPTPVLWVTSADTSTPTPQPFEIVTPPFSPSVTPLSISKTTDLSPGVPEADKGQVIVFHCDGTFELFLSAGVAVPLQPGDVIIDSAPAPSAFGHQPPPTGVLSTITPGGTLPTPWTNITPPNPPTGFYLTSVPRSTPVVGPTEPFPPSTVDSTLTPSMPYP